MKELSTKLDSYLTPYIKINRKRIRDFSVRPEAIKLLEENLGNALFNISLSSYFQVTFLTWQGKQ